MEAKELRIGNYLFDRGNKILQIDWMDEHKVNMKMMVGTMEVHPLTENYENCIPIPLTEELLLKFGFEHVGGYLWNCKEIGECRFLNNPYSVTHFEIKGHTEKNHIRYVHQLQNLYFALTGSELTLE